MKTRLSVVLQCLALSLLLLAPAVYAQKPGKVNLNRASAAQLDALPGIGPATAQRIIEFRKKNGPFKKIEELMNVRGIGEHKFERLKDRITVGSGNHTSKPAPEQTAGSKAP